MRSAGEHCEYVQQTQTTSREITAIAYELTRVPGQETLNLTH